MSNLRLAEDILRSCVDAGVQEFVLCAGARNAPLVSVLSLARGVKTFSFFEERSAAFFALGRIQATGRPVAVVTTSGTAAAELLPATIEADYQGLPLILLTADRPSRYRGSGAPQAIVQPGLFSHYVEKSWDVEDKWPLTVPNVDSSESRFAGLSWKRPIHINVCFDEPILDGRKFSELEKLGAVDFSQGEKSRGDNFLPEQKSGSLGKSHESQEASNSLNRLPNQDAMANGLSAVFSNAHFNDLVSPLVIIGGLQFRDVDFVKEIVKHWNLPVYAEAPSQLRGQLGKLEVLENSIRNLEFESVVRIGSVPTLRLWRDLEESSKPVVHFSHLPYTGLSRSKVVHPIDGLRDLVRDADKMNAPVTHGATDTKASHSTRGAAESSIRSAADESSVSTRSATDKSLQTLLEKYPYSEPGWMNWISRQIPADSRVFLGNSLPIREWDLAATRDRSQKIFVNRGANGIDGLISTFVGISDTEASNWAIIGDLTALYDLSGPWALNQRPELKDVNIVVINNGGGKIFQRLFHNPLFENRHQLHFQDWAKMWKLDYIRFENKTCDLLRAQRPRVIEIIPQEEQTENFWKEWR